MKAETPRDLALMVLNGLSHRSIFSGQYLDDVFQRNTHLGNRDKAFISNLVQGVLRWQLRLDWIIGEAADFPIKKITPPILNILRMALYQIFFLDRVPESAAVNEAVNRSKAYGARHLVAFVNGILRRICRQKDKIPFPDPKKHRVHYLSVFHSYPQWLVKKWIKELGIEFTERLLSAGNRIPVFIVRTNTLKLDCPDLIKHLAEEGISGRPTCYSPEGVLVEGIKGRADELSSFRRGLFQVQDEAAQITSHLIAPEPGETILDICAGLGGKTTHLAALTGEMGRVLALDISHRKLIKLGKNSQRLGIGNINTLVADASGSLSSLFRFKFDKIMVDAPCSGLGVISRHPDGKWNRDEKDITRLALQQKTMINEAASILRKGGRMLYVTCTISEEENEGVVKSCLESHSDLFLENIKDHIPEWGLDLIDNQGFLKTYPHIHHMDGFFGALFTKK
jgi:16S rRNA (cytosine967-C5)-methyltransferase